MALTRLADCVFRHMRQRVRARDGGPANCNQIFLRLKKAGQASSRLSQFVHEALYWRRLASGSRVSFFPGPVRSSTIGIDGPFS